MDWKLRIRVMQYVEARGGEITCCSDDRIVVLDPSEFVPRSEINVVLHFLGMTSGIRCDNTAGTPHKTMTEWHGPWYREKDDPVLNTFRFKVMDFQVELPNTPAGRAWAAEAETIAALPDTRESCEKWDEHCARIPKPHENYRGQCRLCGEVVDCKGTRGTCPSCDRESTFGLIR
jgi:hypothetical protein